MSDVSESDEIISRAITRANRAMFAVDMQLRRLRTSEQEDDTFLGRREADFEFLVVAATRLRRAAVLVSKVPELQQQLTAALNQFDILLPNLKKHRDVAEHIDDYSVDQGFDSDVDRELLEVFMISDRCQTWTWLGETTNSHDLLNACTRLFEVVMRARKQTP